VIANCVQARENWGGQVDLLRVLQVGHCGLGAPNFARTANGILSGAGRASPGCAAAFRHAPTISSRLKIVRLARGKRLNSILMGFLMPTLAAQITIVDYIRCRPVFIKHRDRAGLMSACGDGSLWEAKKSQARCKRVVWLAKPKSM
jgi:hypothetical protein